MKKVNQWEVADRVIAKIDALGDTAQPIEILEVYIRAAAESERAWSTVRHWTKTARAFPPTIRNLDVAFSAHEIFLCLPEQDRLREFFSADSWTVASAERHVKSCVGYTSDVFEPGTYREMGITQAEFSNLDAALRVENCSLVVGKFYAFEIALGNFSVHTEGAELLSIDWVGKAYWFEFGLLDGTHIEMRADLDSLSKFHVVDTNIHSSV